MMISSLHPLPLKGHNFTLLMAEYDFIVCIPHTLYPSTHLSTDSIQTDDNLSLVNRAPINMGMKICLLYSDFDSFGNTHRSN